MKGEGGLKDVLVEQNDVELIIQFTKVPIVIQEQLKPQELISLDPTEYMPIHIASQYVDYGTPIRTWCNYPKDGDSGHTKIIEEAQ